MDIISDMTRQFKSVEEELLNRIDRLDKRSMDNDEEIKKLEQNKKNLLEEIESVRSEKEVKIEGLKSNIEDLSSDFS